jgi:hypothetical protein
MVVISLGGVNGRQNLPHVFLKKMDLIDVLILSFLAVPYCHVDGKLR